jgi:hypothetical protein
MERRKNGARRLLAAVAITAVAWLTSGAHAQIEMYNVPIDGAQTVPPTGSSGTGNATVTLNTATGDVTVVGTYSGLTGNETVAHIHNAPAGLNGGVILGIATYGGGSFSGGGTLTGPQVAELQAGNTYINLHTDVFPAGEIRGQILELIDPVPTVSEWGLIVMGLLLVVAGTLVIRRRRLSPVPG